MSLATLARVSGEAVGLFDRLVDGVVACVQRCAANHSTAKKNSERSHFCLDNQGNQARRLHGCKMHGTTASWDSKECLRIQGRAMGLIAFSSQEGDPLSFLFTARRFSELLWTLFILLWIFGGRSWLGWETGFTGLETFSPRYALLT